jgi:hypothetical protein
MSSGNDKKQLANSSVLPAQVPASPERSSKEWIVDDFCLPPMGYLVRGPSGFLEYRANKDGAIADVVRSDEYDYFASPKQTDFGPIITDGALAMKSQGTDRLVLYEVLKPGAIVLKLGKVPGTAPTQRALKAWAVLTGNRRVELTFPDLRQRADPTDRSKSGNRVELRPVEMRNTLKYEILLSPAK